MNSNEVTDIRLSAQTALWGCVPTSLRAFSGDIRDHLVLVRAIFDETVTDEDKELLGAAAAEIVADYAEPFTIEEEYLVVPTGQSMQHLPTLIFLRYEP